MDYDGNGEISWDEFKAAWLVFFEDYEFRQLEKVFKFADENQDGVLSKDECNAEKNA